MNDPMISTADLARMLGRTDMAVVDASWHLGNRDGEAEYRERHIPGAVYFDIDAISDPATGLPHMLPDPESFAAAVGALGISHDDHIVVYDSVGMFSAARVWWMFRVMGARRVSVLDGGLPKWVADGQAVESGVPRPQPRRFIPAYQSALVRDLEGIRHDLASADVQVADARAADRFAGVAPEPRPGLRSGHMPGARNLPLATLLEPDGRLKSVAALRADLAAAGIDPARPVSATCGSGVTAAVIALAFARLGNDNAAVYDGSWAEWGARDDVEVATGPASH